MNKISETFKNLTMNGRSGTEERENVIRVESKTHNDDQLVQKPYRFIPISEQTSETVELLREIGGGQAILCMIDIFYKKMFQDGYLDQFVHSHDDPHFMRLGNWIIEKMGGEGNVWTNERKQRCPVAVKLPVVGRHVVHDRTSAHIAAWYCPKRSVDDIGKHFKLHDCRVWMRLMFWSAREAGVFNNPTFEGWFIRFIADYIPVYESTAPVFTRESARWSLDPSNLEDYVNSGNLMDESVLGPSRNGVPLQDALRSLPRIEAQDSNWPYNVSI